MLGHLQELFQLEYSSFDVGVSNKYIWEYCSDGGWAPDCKSGTLETQ
jgi:hypothetical protein